MNQPGLNLEAVVIALATQCDGARVRDGRGFSRADAQEGARLSALAKNGIAWSTSDAKRALEMAARHPGQAAGLMSGGNEKLEKALTAALRQGKLPPLSTVEDNRQKKYNLASISAGGRSVNFWKMNWIDDIGGFLSRLHGLSKLKHGERSIRVVNNKTAESTINGVRKRIERWEVPFNSTTLPEITAIAKDFGFALDPAVAAGPDPLVDSLRKSKRACWLRHEGAGKTANRVAVFDLDRADKDFAERVKKQFRGRFSCSPAEDWNWTIDWAGDTKVEIADLARSFNFAVDPEITQ